jgi:hypothetical protein
MFRRVTSRRNLPRMETLLARVVPGFLTSTAALQKVRACQVACVTNPVGDWIGAHSP